MNDGWWAISYVVAVITLAAVVGRDLRDRGVKPLVGAVVALVVLVVPVVGVPMWLTSRLRVGR